MSQTYTIKLPQFEGPFDLLLFFIERDELDIHDIPIARIADDFLNYIRQMESLNIDLASEFILVAATLMRIKAKLLLPRKEIDEEGNEIDPREELVQRLLEYKRYKSVLEEFKNKEVEQSQKNPRGGTKAEIKNIAEIALVDVELESLTLFKLLKAFERVVQRVEDRKRKSIHKVYRYNHTVRGQQIFLLEKIKLGEKKDFQEVFGNCESRIHAIITFLALLELISKQKMYVIERTGVNNFWVECIGGPDDNVEEMEDEDVEDTDVMEESADANIVVESEEDSGVIHELAEEEENVVQEVANVEEAFEDIQENRLENEAAEETSSLGTEESSVVNTAENPTEKTIENPAQGTSVNMAPVKPIVNVEEDFYESGEFKHLAKAKKEEE